MIPQSQYKVCVFYMISVCFGAIIFRNAIFMTTYTLYLYLVISVFQVLFVFGSGVRGMGLNVTFNNISAISRSVFLVEETGVPGENHRPVTSYFIT